MNRLIACGLFLGLGLLAAEGGQPPPKTGDAKTEKQDPQSSFEPRSKPGVGQKFLEKFVGTWTVVKTLNRRTGEPVKQTGECRQTMVHEGRFLQSEFTFEGEAGKTTGTGLIGFEPDTSKFTSVWIDSRQTRMSLRQSEGKFEGETIVLFSKGLDGPEQRRSRTITKLEDEGKKIIHRQFGLNADGTERLVMELAMTKK
jgi:hypothetical protein